MRYGKFHLLRIVPGYSERRGGWRPGVCPWDGSTYGERREGFITQRHCRTCGTHFHSTCPKCGDPQESLGYNQEEDEWGCDQCGAIFKKID